MDNTICTANDSHLGSRTTVLNLNDLPNATTQIDLTFRSVKSINGIDLDILKSGLQKYIRRCEFDKAVWCATELFLFCMYDDKIARATFTNFLNRLKIITLEDIGLGRPQLLILIDYYMEQLKNKNYDVLPKMIHIMCYSNHYRFYSHIRNYIYSTINKSETPADLIESIKIALKHKDLKIVDCLNKLFLYNNSRLTKQYFNVLGTFLVTPVLRKILSICARWYANTKLKESFLMLFHPAYCFIMQDIIDLNIEYAIIDFDDPQIYLKKNLSNKVIIFDNYILDKHTSKGRTRDITIFKNEGSLVAYEPLDLRRHIEEKINSPLKQLYETNYDLNEMIMLIERETEYFKFKIRAQLTCSNSRPDTYFARVDQNNVVVKGPFINKSKVELIYNIMKIMSLFTKVNCFDINIKYLIADQFKNIVQLGTRSTIDNSKPYYFIYMRDLYNIDTYPSIIKNSKYWINTEVVDYDKLFENNDYNMNNITEMSDEFIISLIYQLCIRYAFELGDFAKRNFIRINNMAYNIDIDNIFVGKKIKWKKTELIYISKIWEKNKDSIGGVLNNWITNGPWKIIKSTLDLSNSDIMIIHDNIKFLINNYQDWLK